jgi:hypothetical protein
VLVRGYARGILPQLSDFQCNVDASFAVMLTLGGVLPVTYSRSVSWQSRMQPSVALSSMESEYMAASVAAQEAMWMNRILQQLGLKNFKPITLYEENKAAILFADHSGDRRRSKHIDTWCYFVRETVTNGEIELVYVNTKDQLADGMMKALQPALHRKCLKAYLSHYMFP